MKYSRTAALLFCSLLTLPSLTEQPAQAQILSGPVLGFVPTGSHTGLSPVLGVPGASAFGAPVTFNGTLSGIVVGSRQDYALGVQDADGRRVVAIDLTHQGMATRAMLEGLQGNVVLGIAPSGSTAAIYDNGSHTLHVFQGLPLAPRSVGAFAANVPSEILQVYVSDDGAVALLRSADSMWTLDQGGQPWQVPASTPAAAAFLPNRHDAVITDDATHSAFVLSDIGRANALVLLAFGGQTETFPAVSASEDGDKVYLAGASGEIQIVDVSTRYASRISCGCSPTVVGRMRGTAVFRLMDPSPEPVAVLDASSGTPRIVLIPPRPSE